MDWFQPILFANLSQDQNPAEYVILSISSREKNKDQNLKVSVSLFWRTGANNIMTKKQKKTINYAHLYNLYCHKIKYTLC